MRILVFWIAAFCLTASQGVGAIINVPGDFTSVQDAVDAATDGDEIVIGKLEAEWVPVSIKSREITLRGKDLSSRPSIILAPFDSALDLKNLRIKFPGRPINANHLLRKERIARVHENEIARASDFSLSDDVEFENRTLRFENCIISGNLRFTGGASYGKTIEFRNSENEDPMDIYSFGKLEISDHQTDMEIKIVGFGSASFVTSSLGKVSAFGMSTGSRQSYSKVKMEQSTGTVLAAHRTRYVSVSNSKIGVAAISATEASFSGNEGSILTNKCKSLKISDCVTKRFKVLDGSSLEINNLRHEEMNDKIYYHGIIWRRAEISKVNEVGIQDSHFECTLYLSSVEEAQIDHCVINGTDGYDQRLEGLMNYRRSQITPACYNGKAAIHGERIKALKFDNCSLTGGKSGYLAPGEKKFDYRLEKDKNSEVNTVTDYTKYPDFPYEDKVRTGYALVLMDESWGFLGETTLTPGTSADGISAVSADGYYIGDTSRLTVY